MGDFETVARYLLMGVCIFLARFCGRGVMRALADLRLSVRCSARLFSDTGTSRTFGLSARSFARLFQRHWYEQNL